VPRAGKESGHGRELQPCLLSNLRYDQSDAEFDSALGTAIDEIYEASMEKVTA
jgi:fructose-bisphosphate aldolase, class I